MMRVIDNFLTSYELNEYHSVFSKMAFSQSYDNSNKVNERYKSFATKKNLFSLDQLDDHEKYIYLKLQKNNLLYADEVLKAIFYNALRVGDKFEWHKDWAGHTFLLYVNKIWYPHWGGSTFLKDFPFSKRILPSPGRLLIFKGTTLHKGSAPSIFNQAFARYSLVYQFTK